VVQRRGVAGAKAPALGLAGWRARLAHCPASRKEPASRKQPERFRPLGERDQNWVPPSVSSALPTVSTVSGLADRAHVHAAGFARAGLWWPGQWSRASGSTDTPRTTAPTCPGGDRDGGDPRRGTGAVLDLPGHHRRHLDHPHRQGRPGRVEPAPDGLGRGPRLRSGRQPGLPDPRLRALHPRREATPYKQRGRGRAGSTGPVSQYRGEPAHQGGPLAPGGTGDGDQGARAQRFVVCHNPEQADRYALVRDRFLAHLGNSWPAPMAGPSGVATSSSDR